MIKTRLCNAAFVLCAMSLLLPQLAAAQVQRSILNSGFESPTLVPPAPGNAGCYKLISETLVPGWTTTHPVGVPQGTCTSPTGPSGPLMELWLTPFNGVIARAGSNFAELNAAASSRLYQNVCLINGESIAWRFSHRGRGSTTIPDVMAYNIGASVPVATVSTTSNGTLPAGTPVANQGTINPVPAAVNGWRDYSGTFSYAGATGVNSMGFESISTGSGDNTVGNFLDNIQIELRPFVEFVQSSSSTPESASNNRPTLRVNGTAFQDIVVTVQITGGTATLGTDYTTPTGTNTFTITIPGNASGIQYDGSSASSLFALPVTVVNDAVTEANETIEFGIVPPPQNNPPFLLASSATCGGAVQTTWTYTIVDDDAVVTLGKNAGAAVPVAGNSAQADIAYTIQVSNPSASTPASYGLVDTPGFDPDASVVTASFSLNGGTATALTGGGPWTLQAPSKILAPGATDTYVVNVRVTIGRGGGVGNDACASPGVAGNGLYNAARATIPASGGNPATTFDASACQRTPTPVWVTLRKNLTGRAVATDQAQVRILSGGINAASATTIGAGLPATASTGAIVIPAGNTLQFNESIKTNGTGADRPLTGYQPQIACSNAGTATPNLPSGAGNSTATAQQWAEFSPPAGADIDCTITNSIGGTDLAITKTNTPGNGPNDQAADTLVSGSATNYTLVVTNNGPAPSTGAVVRDTPGAGITCPATNVVTCSSTATPSACPAGPLIVGGLQSGVTLGILPASGGSNTVTLSFNCTVQ